jgi:orotidine-5'-phosphate decarboxylase
MNFLENVEALMAKNKTLLCVGLDPDPRQIPKEFLQKSKPFFEFNKVIVEATKDLVCAYKPQIAYYSAIGAEDELAETIRYIRKLNIPVILDSKRGDIGDTATMYAKEAFERYAADALTVNPYMGGDTLQPYLKYAEKGVIVLCKTSNAGSGDLQDLPMNSAGSPLLYEIVAQKAAREWNQNKNVMLVVGATHTDALLKIRGIVGDMTLLVPGVGAQGGDLKAVLKAGLNSKRKGLIVNSSRGILYAGSENVAASAQAAALKVVTEMREFL